MHMRFRHFTKLNVIYLQKNTFTALIITTIYIDCILFLATSLAYLSCSCTLYGRMIPRITQLLLRQTSTSFFIIINVATSMMCSQLLLYHLYIIAKSISCCGTIETDCYNCPKTSLHVGIYESFFREKRMIELSLYGINQSTCSRLYTDCPRFTGAVVLCTKTILLRHIKHLIELPTLQIGFSSQAIVKPVG